MCLFSCRTGKDGYIQIDGGAALHGQSKGKSLMVNTKGSIYLGEWIENTECWNWQKSKYSLIPQRIIFMEYIKLDSFPLTSTTNKIKMSTPSFFYFFGLVNLLYLNSVFFLPHFLFSSYLAYVSMKCVCSCVSGSMIGPEGTVRLPDLTENTEFQLS